MNIHEDSSRESVFVYRKGALGDTIFYIPLLFHLKNYYSKIYFAGNYLYRSLFQGMDFIQFLDADSLYVFNLLRGSCDTEKFHRFYIFSRSFEKISPDFYIYDPIPENEWVYSYPFRLLNEKFELPAIYFPVFYNEVLFRQVKDKKFFIFHPGSGGMRKIWHINNFFAIEKYLNEKGFEIYYLLGESEKNRIDEFRGKKIFYNYSLNDIIFLLQYASGFVGADTGIGHLAGLLGVNGFMLFGSSNEKIYKPMRSIRAIKLSDDVNDIKPEHIIEHLGELVEKR